MEPVSSLLSKTSLNLLLIFSPVFAELLFSARKEVFQIVPFPSLPLADSVPLGGLEYSTLRKQTPGSTRPPAFCCPLPGRNNSHVSSSSPFSALRSSLPHPLQTDGPRFHALVILSNDRGVANQRDRLYLARARGRPSYPPRIFTPLSLRGCKFVSWASCSRSRRKDFSFVLFGHDKSEIGERRKNKTQLSKFGKAKVRKPAKFPGAGIPITPFSQIQVL